jgi:hypothetical protein
MTLEMIPFAVRAASQTESCDGLTDPLRLSRELEAATQQAVSGLRGFGRSWADIAARLGSTR